MKKLLPFAGLLLAASGSWAFYPKPPTQAGAYMQVDAGYVFGKGSITLIPADGAASEIQIKESGIAQARVKTMAKLTELRQEGWRVVQMSSAAPNPNSIREIYLLEKP